MLFVFINLIKAFDAAWREGLWCKLLMNQIIGKMHNVIVNMHRNVKSVAKYKSREYNM